MLLVSFKNIRISIIFAILSASLKKVNIYCHNMKVKNIYTSNFNQNQNCIKKFVYNLLALTQ